MAEEINVRPDSPTGGSSGPSNFADLDSKTQRSAFRMLGMAAVTYACVYLAVFVTDWITQIVAMGRFAFPGALHSIISLAAIGYSLLVAYRVRKANCAPCAFVRM